MACAGESPVARAGASHPGSARRGRRGRGTEGPGRGLEAAGGALRKQRSRQKPPVLGPRASDAGKCPHPGNLRRSAAAATPSGRQNGGGGGNGLVLRGEPGPRDPRDGPRWPAAAPPGSSPRPVLPGILRLPGRASGRLGVPSPARGRCPGDPQSLAGRSGAGVAGGAHSLLASGSWRGGGRRGPRPSPLAGLQGLLRPGRLAGLGAGPTWLVAGTRAEPCLGEARVGRARGWRTSPRPCGLGGAGLSGKGHFVAGLAATVSRLHTLPQHTRVRGV